jgi:hypothetical protein
MCATPRNISFLPSVFPRSSKPADTFAWYLPCALQSKSDGAVPHAQQEEAAMTIGDICNRNVVVAPKTEMIVDAAKRMRTSTSASVIVESRDGHTPSAS